MADLYVDGFSPYAGFNGTVASVVTKALTGIGGLERADKGGLFDDYRRPAVPSEFPGSSQINQNANQLKILNKLEEQYNRIQDSRDVAGQTLKSLRGEKANDKTLKEMQAYKSQLTNENNKLLKQGSAKVQKQKNDTESAAIAAQIAKSRGQNNSKNISQMEIDAFRAAASKPASVKKEVLKKANKKKPAKPKGRK